MIKTEHILEFDKIKETWKTFALTESARTEIEKTEPMMSEREVAARLRETSEAKNMIEKFGQPPLAAMSNIREWMHIAETGGCLTPEQLEEAEKALVAVERMKKYLCQGKNYHIPLAFYEENLYSFEDIREAINQQIRGGQVCDCLLYTSCCIEKDHCQYKYCKSSNVQSIFSPRCFYEKRSRSRCRKKYGYAVGDSAPWIFQFQFHVNRLLI